jgi:Ca-activated chloride channel family protein
LHVERGTSLANGIVVSLNAIATAHGEDPILNIQQPPPPKNVEDSAAIVLLTDGENNMDPDPLMAAQIAADRGVRIHTVAIGSAEGTLLTVNGFTVFTKLDEPTMQAISDLTDGEYYNAQTEEDLQAIYEGIDPKMMMKPEETEITAVFAGLSILLLLVGGVLSLLWFGRVP